MTDPRVAIYIRVSTTHQIDKDSLPMQRQDLIAYTKLMLHTTNYVIFEDAGYSGKNMDRPRFQSMMKQIRQGLFTHVLVWKIDRISRNLLDFASMYEELKSLGVTFVSKNEQFDTSTAMGEAMLKIILVFAELERNMTSERVTATMISRASNGQWNGGRVPFGYSYDSEKKEFYINEKEAPIVRLIHDTYEQNSSLLNLTRILNDSGYKTRAGNEWSPISVRIILKNFWYTGCYQYNRLKDGCRQKEKDQSEWVTIPNHHPALISLKQKERIVEMLRSNYKLIAANNIYYTSNNVHVFGGLVTCAYCGRRYIATTDTKKGWKMGRYGCPTRRYSKTKCTNNSVSDLTLGDFVFNYFVNLLKVQKHAKDITTTDELQRQLLSGYTFSSVKGLSPQSLLDTLRLIHTLNPSEKIYGKTKAIKKIAKPDKQLFTLRAKQSKLKRALDRLTTLYLYSESSMSEADFVAKKAEITDNITKTEAEISELVKTDIHSDITDSEFLRKASEFVISQQLASRNYISYERLARTVDVNITREFIVGTIEQITVRDGHIESILFRNGLSHKFIY